MRFARANRGAVHQAQSLDAVRAAVRGQLFERGFLLRAVRHDEFAAIPVRHVVRGAEFVHHPVPGDAQLRLQRTRRIVDARMNHAAISRARAHAEFRHLLDKKHIAPAPGNRARHRAAHHAAANDQNVCAIHGRQDKSFDGGDKRRGAGRQGGKVEESLSFFSVPSVF